MQLIDQDGQKNKQKRRTDNRDAPVVKTQDAAQCAACICAIQSGEEDHCLKAFLLR